MTLSQALRDSPSPSRHAKAKSDYRGPHICSFLVRITCSSERGVWGNLGQHLPLRYHTMRRGGDMRLANVIGHGYFMHLSCSVEKGQYPRCPAHSSAGGCEGSYAYFCGRRTCRMFGENGIEIDE